MNAIYDDALARLLIGRRGRLHAFPALPSERTAIVVLDAVASTIDGRPEVAAAIEALTVGGRMAGATVCWIKPTPPAAWRAAPAARALLGDAVLAAAARRMEPGAADGAVAPALTPDPADWMAHKAGHSAFFPGNCSLPDWLAAQRVDTVVLAGAGAAVGASAVDAFEAGFRVVICGDATAGLDIAVLRDLARDRGDVRTAADIAALLAG